MTEVGRSYYGSIPLLLSSPGRPSSLSVTGCLAIHVQATYRDLYVCLKESFPTLRLVVFWIPKVINFGFFGMGETRLGDSIGLG